MFIQRYSKIKVLAYFIIAFSLATPSYSKAEHFILTICFDNNAHLPKKENYYIYKSDFVPSYQYALAHHVKNKNLSSLALNTSWCNKNYTCYRATLPSDMAEKQTVLITSTILLPQKEEQELHPLHPIVNNQTIMSSCQKISLMQSWRYHHLTNFHISQINSQRYDIKFTNFKHPQQKLNFDIKVRTQKWSVVDNKYGSALIRLDLKSS